MYYKERTEFATLSFSSVSAVDDDPLEELHRSAEIDRREPVRLAASQFSGVCFTDDKLGMDFFCSRDFESMRKLRAIFQIVAIQLAYRPPQLRAFRSSFIDLGGYWHSPVFTGNTPPVRLIRVFLTLSRERIFPRTSTEPYHSITKNCTMPFHELGLFLCGKCRWR